MNDLISVVSESGQWTYFVGLQPVFSHAVCIPSKPTTDSAETDHPSEKLDRWGLLGLKVVGLRRNAWGSYWHFGCEANVTGATGRRRLCSWISAFLPLQPNLWVALSGGAA